MARQPKCISALSQNNRSVINDLVLLTTVREAHFSKRHGWYEVFLSINVVGTGKTTNATKSAIARHAKCIRTNGMARNILSKPYCGIGVVSENGKNRTLRPVWLAG